MSNMSYCRFRNTLNDLRDCIESINDDVSIEKHNARRAMINEMIDVLTDIGCDVNEDDIDQDLMEKK